MTVSPLDSDLWSGLYGDPGARDCLDDRALLGAMVEVEIALAQAGATLGLIPAQHGPQISEVLSRITVDPAELTKGAVQDGVPVPALLRHLRARLGPDLAESLHWGATSQDIVDTATVLCLKHHTDRQSEQIAAVLRHMAKIAQAEADTVMSARTRTQIALPTSFGAVVAGWGQPLADGHRGLVQAVAEMSVLSLHGAAGTGAAFAGRDIAVRDAVAAQLGLQSSDLSWHNRRDALARFAAATGGLAASIGRICADLGFLASSSIGEVALAGGGSSTMPHKVNPVRAEAGQSLARFATHLQAAVSESALHQGQRDGAAWGLEWLALRPLCGATAAALMNLRALFDGLRLRPERMAGNLAEAGFGPYAEGVTFALAQQMPRSAAQAAVAHALQSERPEQHLRDSYPDLPWAQLLEPLAAAGAAPRIARDFAAAHRGRAT